MMTRSGCWLFSARRHLLDLTQDELARQVGCSVVTIRKLEADERRPSKQIAERLAASLDIAEAERAAFLTFARAESPPDATDVPLPVPRWRPPAHPPRNIPHAADRADRPRPGSRRHPQPAAAPDTAAADLGRPARHRQDQPGARCRGRSARRPLPMGSYSSRWRQSATPSWSSRRSRRRWM